MTSLLTPPKLTRQNVKESDLVKLEDPKSHIKDKVFDFQDESVRNHLDFVIKDVYTVLGRGRRESAYQKALAYQLNAIGYPAQTEYPVPILYRGSLVGTSYIDIIVLGKFFIELKVTERSNAKEIAQTQAYSRDLKLPGLLIHYPQGADKGECQVTFIKGETVVKIH